MDTIATPVRYAVKSHWFSNLNDAIDHATRAYDTLPAIMESALDDDGEGWSWVAVHRPEEGGNGMEYTREEFVRE